METDFKKKITTSTAVIMILTLIGYGIGFITQIIIATYFGTGVDAFVAASLVPEFVFGMTNVIFLTSFLVIFPEILKKRGQAEGKTFVRGLFTFLLCILCFLFFFSIFFAPILAKLIAPGFSEEQYIQTVTMIRILSLAMVFLGMSSLTTAILYHEQKFISSKALRIILGGGIILGVLFFEKYFGVISLAIGTVVGIVCAFFVQYTVIKKMRYSFSFISWEEAKERIKDPSVQELFSLSLPLLASSAMYYVTKSISTILASTQGQGSVSSLNYAFILVNIPVIFFSGSVTTAIFPHITRQYAEQQSEEMRRLCTKALRVLLVVFIPITWILMLLSREIIQMVFERGEFTSATTETVAVALLFYAIGLVPSGIWGIILTVFYTKKRMKQQLGIHILLFFITVLGSMFFMRYFLHNGIALGWSLAYWVATGIAFWYAVKKLECIDMNKVKGFSLKILFASGVMTLFLFFIKKMNVLLPSTASPLWDIFLLISLLSVGTCIYLLVLKLLGESEEIALVFTLLKVR